MSSNCCVCLNTYSLKVQEKNEGKEMNEKEVTKETKASNVSNLFCIFIHFDEV